MRKEECEAKHTMEALRQQVCGAVTMPHSGRFGKSRKTETGEEGEMESGKQ